ncbi:MAG: hypothetical protein JSS99_04695 [Actinobacteria bacterium]|nr:hypothetical protein [Actinomycetota bacterium]
MRRWRDACGQATSEWVALVLLVAVVLALAAGLTSGGGAGHVLAGLQRGLCHVAGVPCARPQPPADELAPCPLERTTRREALDGAFELVRLGRSGTLTTVRDSDGRVTVSLLDGSQRGGEVGLGLHVSAGRRLGVGVSASVGLSVTSGRSWTLPSAAAARAFVARYGSKATLGGKAVDAVRSGCSILCDALGWRPHAELPPPDERSVARGGLAQLKVALPVAALGGSAGALIGASTRRDGGSTWFLQVDAGFDLAAAVGPGGAAAGREGEAVVSYSLDAQGRPSRLVVHTVTRFGAAAGLRGIRGVARAGTGAGAQLVTELDGTLDLHDARNRAAADALVAALRDPLALGALARRAAAVRERIARAGVVDRRTYALSSSALALGLDVTASSRLGADFERTTEGMRLLSAETRLPGLPFLPRDDCRPGAAAA